jgi:hypothetical protein
MAKELHASSESDHNGLSSSMNPASGLLSKGAVRKKKRNRVYKVVLGICGPSVGLWVIIY